MLEFDYQTAVRAIYRLQMVIERTPPYPYQREWSFVLTYSEIDVHFPALWLRSLIIKPTEWKKNRGALHPTLSLVERRGLPYAPLLVEIVDELELSTFLCIDDACPVIRHKDRMSEEAKILLGYFALTICPVMV